MLLDVIEGQMKILVVGDGGHAIMKWDLFLLKRIREIGRFRT